MKKDIKQYDNLGKKGEYSLNKELYGNNQLELGLDYDNSLAVLTANYIAKDKQNVEYVDFFSGADILSVGVNATTLDNLDFWENVDISHENQMKAKFLRKSLAVIVKRHPEIKGSLKGQGLYQGIACGIDGLAQEICEVAKENSLLVGTSGEHNEVIMIMPPNTIDIYGLEKGLEILNNSINNPKIQLMIRQYNSEQMQKLAGF